MLMLHGQIVSVNKAKTQKQQLPITELQVLANGGKYNRLVDLVDFENREWKVGQKVELPVYVKAWQSKRGNIGVSYHMSRR